jgi:hypothetical protein
MNLSIFISPSLQERVEKAAAAQGRSPEDFVRAVLESVLPAPATPNANTHANGTPSPPTQRFLPDSEEWAQINADDRWILDQFNQGALEAYAGNFVAVYNQRVIAHDPQYPEAQRKAALVVPDVPVARFAIMYVENLD